MRLTLVVTPLVTQSEQALHPAITELELISSGMESGRRLAEDKRRARLGVGPGHMKQGYQQDHHL